MLGSCSSLQIQMPLKFSNMEASKPPHVLVLPHPADSHIKPMFNLAKLLSKHGPFKITFVHSHPNHASLRRFTDLSAFHAQYPNFHFASITDGLPPDHPSHAPLPAASQCCLLNADLWYLGGLEDFFLRSAGKQDNGDHRRAS